MVPRDAAALAWMANLGYLELHRILCAQRTSNIRMSCGWTGPSARRGVEAVLETAAVVKTTLDDFGLTGWPKTSGSRGMH